jgi:oxygen-independent coproporphyrinogen III oxidase
MINRAVLSDRLVQQLHWGERRISPEALPIAAEKLQILQMTIEELTANGYIFIGMDHFAKPNDELAIAQQQGQLHRNFQGYTIKPESDLLGFGVTSISMLDTVYVQNQRRLRPFYQAVEQGKWPIGKGITLHREDKIRRAVIMELMCQFRISQVEFTRKYALDFELDFAQYFVEEHFQLRCLEADGLLNILPDGLEVTPAGRLLIRNIAAVFDTYLQQHQLDKFSQAV